jgi:NAD+ kinase
LKIAFVASRSPEAMEGLKRLEAHYGKANPNDADVIVALGGDGFMLSALHRFMNSGTPVYGMNKGTIGFLMNEYSEENLPARLKAAVENDIQPLVMIATDCKGKVHQHKAINEVSLLRQSYQAASLRISIDGKVRLETLVGDGVLVATPAGSTAYNLSAHGPILPLDAPLLALTPISPFRPRRWRGALIPANSEIEITVNEADKRPVNAVADHFEVKSVRQVTVRADAKSKGIILFDPDHSWDEQIQAARISGALPACEYCSWRRGKARSRSTFLGS